MPIVQNLVPELESVPEDVTYCEICGRCDREDRLLLCDGCDFGYHCECLSPPLETIPIEEWFCPDCFQQLFGRDECDNRLITRQRRAIARTGASEAVRQRILARRTQKKKRKTKTRRRKTRKTKTRRGTKGKTTGRKRKTRRKKRKTRKSRLASRPLPRADARTRIASKLGIGHAPISPFGLPTMKNIEGHESIRNITNLRAAAGISNLSLFGSELDNYDPRVYYDDFESESFIDGGVGTIARARVGQHLISPLKKSNCKIFAAIF